MKKKVLIILIIFLGVFFLILLSKIGNFLEHDKTMTIGCQKNETTIEYSKEIRDKKKIKKFEKWFDQIDFGTGDLREEFPDIILRIHNNTKGYTSHTLEVWTKYETAIATIKQDENIKKGQVSKLQLEEILEKIKDLTN